MKKKKTYSKYELYEASVQDSKDELHFFQRVYTNEFGKKPTSFREDFCSTFLNSCTWVKSGPNHIAYAVDRDAEPLAYGTLHHFEKLNPSQKERLKLFNDNVLTVKTPSTDLITVSNFSICFLKTRAQMLAYFKSCLDSLHSEGIMIFDLLGGQEIPDLQEDKTSFTLPDGTKAHYFWEHAFYNPITNEAKFYIHYQIKGEKKMERVFSYDWRMWSLSEFKDILTEVGFRRVDVYWEGDDPKTNEGNGIFRKATKAQSCPIWLAYVVGVK